jgi:hypothetical protein
MSRLNHLSFVVVVLVTTVAFAARSPRRPDAPSPRRTRTRYARQELRIFITEVIWGPGGGELAFLGWEKPVGDRR